MKKLKADEVLALVLKDLDDGKAMDIVTIPLAGKTSIADYMVIASGTSQRQVAALAERIVFDLKKKGVKTSIEGKSGGEWVIVDAFDVIVHIFYPETRNFYDLEDMWKQAPAKEVS
jgi:ribosome-associated protein